MGCLSKAFYPSASGPAPLSHFRTHCGPLLKSTHSFFLSFLKKKKLSTMTPLIVSTFSNFSVALRRTRTFQWCFTGQETSPGVSTVCKDRNHPNPYCTESLILHAIFADSNLSFSFTTFQYNFMEAQNCSFVSPNHPPSIKR